VKTQGIDPGCFAGLLGSAIDHSLSPRMHRAWFAEAGRDSCYLSFSLPSAPEALALVQALLPVRRFLGLNLTLPYKGILLERGGFRASSRVLATGAANTLYRLVSHVDGEDGSEWALENTDIDGIRASMKALDTAPSSSTPLQVICLGAGGAARAVPAALVGDGVTTGSPSITFLCREPERARLEWGGVRATDAAPFTFEALENVEAVVRKRVEVAPNTRWLVINTLPLGATELTSPTNPYAREVLEACAAAGCETAYFDMIYVPTEGLSTARALGFAALDGRLMLQEQGRAAFTLWTGFVPASDPLIDRSALLTPP